jgi:hypothetical protein
VRASERVNFALTLRAYDASYRRGHAIRAAPHKEPIMFATLASKLENLFCAAENEQRDTYFEASTDLADLERRMRYYESNHSPFGWHASSGPTDWHA